MYEKNSTENKNEKKQMTESEISLGRIKNGYFITGTLAEMLWPCEKKESMKVFEVRVKGRLGHGTPCTIAKVGLRSWDSSMEGQWQK